MKASTAKAELLDKGLAIDHEQFEHLCKMVIERAEPTRELELTPFRGDGGIDIHVVDRPRTCLLRLRIPTGFSPISKKPGTLWIQ